MSRGAAFLAENERQLAWIMGSSRSGSTWLTRMLGSIDGTACIDDPHLGHHLGVWRPLSLAWATSAEPPQLAMLSELKAGSGDYLFSDRHRDAWMPALRDLIRARFGAQLDERGRDPAAVFVKEPGSQAAPMIFDAFPHSRLIFLLRDGRDVVESWLDGYRADSWAIEGGAYPVTRSGRLPLIEWLSSVWATRTRIVWDVFARLDDDSRLLVRYEDLLADPVGQLDRICALLGLDTAELGQIAERHRFSRLAPGERGAMHHARRASPGGWRETMSRSERRAMERAMGPVLREAGYAVRPAAA
jgi:LPS sulfotransferase NodH